MTEIFCVQHQLICSSESNADNSLKGINTAFDAISTAWENQKNRNSNRKEKSVHGSDKWVVFGVCRMGSEIEKNILINMIRGLGNPPHIKGKIKWHRCKHFSWKCVECGYSFDSKELPPNVCPSCGSPAETIVDDKLRFIVVPDAKPCVIEEEWIL